jgi:hypothetical protein
MTQAQQQRARVLGSNFTTFRYAGKNIAYLEEVSDSGQRPVAPVQEVHPLGYRHPTELVAARAIRAGSLQLSIREIWHQEVWQQMAGLANSHDILEVFEALAAQVNYVTCTKIITPPDGRKYGKTYHQCVITDITDGETFNIETMSIPKGVTVAYTHTTPL